MKKLLVLALVLSVATVANAGLTIGTTATEIQKDSGIAVLSITGDGGTDPGAFYFGIVAGGAATLDLTNASVLYPGNATNIFFEDMGGALGTNEPLVHIELNGVPPVGQSNPPLTGLLVDGIALTGQAAGVVTIQLFDGGGTMLSSADVTITDVPEPITVGLLGLGAMFLRRRK